MGGVRDRIDVAWVSCRAIPEPDPDEEPALAALRRAGLSIETLAWDDPESAPPSRFSICVLRSCWNYYEDAPAFSRWIDQADGASRLLNPPGFLHWNLHKGYLARLAEGGIPIVPTVFLERGSRPRFDGLLSRENWRDVVIKPAVSAGSFATRRFREDQAHEAQDFLEQHLACRDMLMQPFVQSVDTVGEKCLVWIDGAFTHAVIKQPKFDGQAGAVSGALPVDEACAALGHAALACACDEVGLALSDLLYARVDIVEHDREWVIGELELLEPSLYLLQSPAALERFVRALAALCK